MAEYVTFGRFGREEHWKRDKEVFLIKLKYLISSLVNNKELYEKSSEIEIAKSLKELLKNPKSDIHEPLIIFMIHMGLSYDILKKEKKEEIKEMEFTYENWEKKSEELYNDYLERSVKSCPKDIHFCLYYRLFIINVLSGYDCELTKDNFLRYIRDFFILEKDKCIYEDYIDFKEFNKLKDKVIEIYPRLKEVYGGNIYLEKYFFCYIGQNTDYNYKIVENILDNYYNKKKINNVNDDDDEKMKLKND